MGKTFTNGSRMDKNGSSGLNELFTVKKTMIADSN